jgi:hypothetical protein
MLKLSCCLTKHHTIKVYGVMEVSLHALTSVLDRSEQSASLPDRFTPEKKASGASLDGTETWSGHSGEEKTIPYPATNRTLVIQLVA